MRICDPAGVAADDVEVGMAKTSGTAERSADVTRASFMFARMMRRILEDASQPPSSQRFICPEKSEFFGFLGKFSPFASLRFHIKDSYKWAPQYLRYSVVVTGIRRLLQSLQFGRHTGEVVPE